MASLTSLLVRCPFHGDNYKTQMIALDNAKLPFPSHYQRFTIATFALLDAGSQRALRGPVRISVPAPHLSGISHHQSLQHPLS